MRVPMTLTKFCETYGWPQSFVDELRSDYGLRVISTGKTKGLYPEDFTVAFEEYAKESDRRRQLREVSGESLEVSTQLPGRDPKARPTSKNAGGSQSPMDTKVQRAKKADAKGNIAFRRPVLVPGGGNYQADGSRP